MTAGPASWVDDHLACGTIEQHALLVQHVAAKDALSAGRYGLYQSGKTTTIDFNLGVIK